MAANACLGVEVIRRESASPSIRPAPGLAGGSSEAACLDEGHAVDQ